MSQHAAGSSVSPSAGPSSAVQAQQPGDPAAAAQAGQGGPQQAPKGHQGIDVFAMLPLDVVDTDAVFKCASAPWFGQALSLLAASGVHGVAVDVWWGAVERTPGDYKWTGYRQLVSLVKQAGLKMQAVMSFHACGGNTGDNAHISLPPWVLQCGKEDPDLFFTDRPRNGLGQRNREYLSIWASDARLLCGRTAYECYEDFMKAFKEAFAQDLGDTIEEVVVGAGPCGELRFPSYPECHGWRFPGIGEFQCYDRHALASLAQAARAAGHPEWGYGGPHDAGHYNSVPEDTGFFSHAGNWDTPYGRFFLNWYSSCLLNHGERLLQMATRIFSASPARVQMATPRSNTCVAASSPPPGAQAALGSSRSNKGAGSSTLVPGAYVLPVQQACQPSPGLASRDGRLGERAALVLHPPAAGSLPGGEHGQAQQLQGDTHASPAQPAQQQQQQPLLVATSSLQGMLHDSVLQCCAAPMPAKSPGPSQQSLLSRDSAASTTSSVPVMLLGSEPGSEANMSASTLAAVPPATSAAMLAGLQQQQIPDPAAALVQRPVKAGFGASRMQQQQHALTVPPEVVPAAPEPAVFECDLAALAIGQHQQQQRGPGVSTGRTSSTSGGSSGLTVLTSGLGSTGILASAPAIIMPSQPPQSASPADGAMLSAGLSTLSASVMGPASPSPTALERPSGISMYGAPSMTLVSSSTGTLSNCGSGGGGPPDTARSFVHDLCGGPPPRPHVSASCHSIPTLALTASPLGQAEAPASQHLGSLYLSEPVQSVAPASATPSPLASTCYYAPAAAPGGVVSDTAGAAVPALPLPKRTLCGADGAAASPTGAPQPETPTQPQGSGSGAVKHLASSGQGGEDLCAEQPQRRRRHVVLQADEEGAPGPSPVGICPRMRELGQSMGHLSISSSGSLSSAQELSELNSSEEVVQQRSSVDASCSTGSATLPSLGCISSTSPPSGSLLASAGGASSDPDHGVAGPAHVASGAAVAVAAGAAAATGSSSAAGGSAGGRSRHQLTLSLKIPGVHWWYRSRSHAAELTAGYYNTATRDGYEPVVDLCARYGVALTLTCVEMCDGQHPLTAACSPEGLLKQVRVLTARRGVLLSGENALPIFLPQGGVDTVAMDRIVINTRAWYGPRAIESVASQHAALLAAQQSQWIRQQQQPLACHASLPMPRGSMWPALQPTYPGCTSTSVSNSGAGGPGAGMAGGWGYNGWHSGQCQYSGNVGGGSMPGSNSGSGVYDAGTLTTGPIYQREESSSSSGTGAGYGYGSGRGAGHGNIVGQGWGSGIGQGYGYGNCWPMASCSAGLHRNISASSADTALQQLHAAGGPHGGAWGLSNGAMGQAGSCHASASTSSMQPRAMSLGGGGGGGVDVPLGLPGEQHGVAACGLRTDSYADIKEPLPSMRSFTFLRLGPEIMLPGVLAPWLRFISGMQQGGYS